MFTRLTQQCGAAISRKVRSCMYRRVHHHYRLMLDGPVREWMPIGQWPNRSRGTVTGPGPRG